MLLKIFQHAIIAEQLCHLGTSKMLCLLVLLYTEGKKVGNIQTPVAHSPVLFANRRQRYNNIFNYTKFWEYILLRH